MEFNRLRGKTELQKEIINAIAGHTASEIIHAFECIKLNMLLQEEK